MNNDLRQHAEALCSHINHFLASRGKNPDRTGCLVDFIKRTELASEYCEVAGEMGWPALDIDHFIADDWLGGYWAWIQDGGSIAKLKALDMDAPRRTVVLRDLINLGVGGIYRSMGLLRSPDAFKYTVGFCKHLFSTATKGDIEDAFTGNSSGRMAVISLSKYLQTKQFKPDQDLLYYDLEAVSVLAGCDDQLFHPRLFSAKQDVYRRDNPHDDVQLHLGATSCHEEICRQYDQALAETGSTDENTRNRFNLIDRLDSEYKMLTAADSDAYGRLARPKQAASCLHPVIMPRLYECVENGDIDSLWRIALGRCTLFSSYFPTKRRPADEYVKAALALMIVRDVESTMGISFPRQDTLNAVDAELAKRWEGYSADDRKTLMAVLCTIGYSANIAVYRPSSDIKRGLQVFETALNAELDSSARQQALEVFITQHLQADYRQQLWPALIANAKALSLDPLLGPLQPHLALAWHWGQTFHYAGDRNELYGPTIIAHDGWKRSLAKDPHMTAHALTLAHQEHMLDPKLSASLEVSGAVLRLLDFKLPAGISDRAMATDLGL
ncbi:hypothetical protein PLA107_032705 (plasmid) [Pseudomonas amygdali pv. lachrymans str. M301315]|uniref:Uncharacterized protein n=3 Tax=Pseudomonas amygdali TaxID=47877 RepID=A0ABR5KRZ8_PSEAV|nr:hypothetical protein PLA107_032705 [Pseudomonas amygdali pv. lachrymans str. M301315]KPC17393.1 Uncharacterized protein AC499_0595 [Pseudomonas amygdali pv. lachrymans]